MNKFRTEYHADVARLIRGDLARVQLSERVAAKGIGMSASTFNAFLNLEYRKAQDRTLTKLLACPLWSCETRTALTLLRDYDSNLFATLPLASKVADTRSAA